VGSGKSHGLVLHRLPPVSANLCGSCGENGGGLSCRGGRQAEGVPEGLGTPGVRPTDTIGSALASLVSHRIPPMSHLCFSRLWVSWSRDPSRSVQIQDVTAGLGIHHAPSVAQEASPASGERCDLRGLPSAPRAVQAAESPRDRGQDDRQVPRTHTTPHGGQAIHQVNVQGVLRCRECGRTTS
jgi:hypothetical protein